MTRRDELEEIYRSKLRTINEKLEDDPEYEGYLDDMAEVSTTLELLIKEENHLEGIEVSKEKRKAIHDISKKDIITWGLTALGAAVPIGIEIGKAVADDKRHRKELDFRRETRDMVFRYECDNDEIFTTTVGKSMSSSVYPKK